MNNSKQLGNLTELQCITYLYSLGCSVSIPYGNSDKYDLILDVKGRLYKVQVKHCAVYYDKNNVPTVVRLKSSWLAHNTTGYQQTKYLPGEFDLFATFYNNKCYLIPFESSSFVKSFRLQTAKNNQKNKVHMLEDYLADTMIETL